MKRRRTTLLAVCLCWMVVGCPAPDAKSNNVNNVNNLNNGNNSNNGNNANNSNNSVDYFSCTQNDECMVRSIVCCGVCAEETPENSIAINAAQNQTYGMFVCADGTDCPACETPRTPTLLATCDNGTCALVDLKTDPATECVDATDCVLRTNTCCECTDVTMESVVAVNANALQAIPGYTCGAEIACDDCVPTYEGWEALCVDDRCVAGPAPIP